MSKVDELLMVTNLQEVVDQKEIENQEEFSSDILVPGIWVHSALL